MCIKVDFGLLKVTKKKKDAIGHNLQSPNIDLLVWRWGSIPANWRVAMTEKKEKKPIRRC